MPPETLEGLTLEQYAGVTVAVAEGYPLDAVLANESLSPSAWPPAHAAWTARIAGDGSAGPTFAAYRDKRAVAEDWLARPAPPIDTDLAAWLGFLRAWTAHAAPFELLAGAGLGMNDLARLQRRWARRMAEDGALQKQAAELTKKGAGPLPAIRAQAGELRPFPWSKGPAKPKDAPAPAPAAAPGSGVETLLDFSFYAYVSLKAVLAETAGDPDAVLRKLGNADFAEVDAAWRARLEGDPALARDYRRVLEHERGRLRAAAKRGPEAPATAAAADPAPARPRVPPPSPLAGTSLALDVPRGPVLPFAEPARLPEGLGAAALTAKGPQGAARGFVAAPHPLAETSLALDIPRGAALPFADRLGVPARSPLPGAAPPAASDAPPALTLQQHASLCCELTGAPERAAETLARYRITAAEKQAEDRRYAERFAREPGLREAWDGAFRAYREWWIESARRDVAPTR